MEKLYLTRSALIGLAVLCSLTCYGQGMRNLLRMNSGHGTHAIPLGVLPMQFNRSFAGKSEGGRLSGILTFNGYHEERSMQNTGYHAFY